MVFILKFAFVSGDLFFVSTNVDESANTGYDTLDTIE